MAAKRFNGAPFGTQTARFDVTGVHPKTKIPGSFTQIPYDKYSMMEQKCGSHTHPNKRNGNVNHISKIDVHLKHIRIALNAAKEGLKEIESMKRNKSRTGVIVASTNELKCVTSKALSAKQNMHKGSIDHSHKHIENCNSVKGKGTSLKYDKRSHKDVTFGAEKDGSSFNVSQNSMNDENTETFSDEEVRIEPKGVTNIEKDPIQSEIDSLSLDLMDSGVVSILATESKEKTQRRSSNNLSTIKEFQSKLLNTKEIIEHDDRGEISQPSGANPLNAPLSSVETPITSFENIADKSMLPKILKADYKHRYMSSECVVPRNSVAAETSTRARRTWQKKEKLTPCDEFLKRKLGPGTYNTVVGGFSPNCVETRASGPGWGRQLEVERLAALPHLLYKEQWEENKMLKRKLGPGSYEIKDFIQMSNLKPRSSKGICENLATRFDKGIASFTPGPGTYGMGGVPQRAIEEKGYQSTSTKGMLDSGDRKRNLPSVGSHLGPGTYRHKTCTEEMLNKVTSLKGPYELYSGDRNKPISEGYQAAPKLADLGPGQYEIGSFVDELHSVHKKSHGGFGKLSQYPDVPTERLFLFSQAHCRKMKEFPGPGAYSVQDYSKPQAVNSPGFLSSAKRDDKLSQKFFTRNFNPVGAGRYDIQKLDEAQDINGHTSVFKSKTGKPGLQMAKFLQK